jgi:hypothetical protein
MSPHGLRVRSVTGGADVIHIGADSPARGVAILDVTIGSTSTPAPLHWRAGDWKKPPFDVSLGSDGRPESVQVVFQDEEIPMTDSLPSIDVEPGVPLFDVGGWPTDRYLDARAVVHAKRLPSGELAVSIGEDPANHWLGLGEGLQFGLDLSGEVVEIRIGPLDDEQWRVIAAASP